MYMFMYMNKNTTCLVVIVTFLQLRSNDITARSLCFSMQCKQTTGRNGQLSAVQQLCKYHDGWMSVWRSGQSQTVFICMQTIIDNYDAKPPRSKGKKVQLMKGMGVPKTAKLGQKGLDNVGCPTSKLFLTCDQC